MKLDDAIKLGLGLTPISIIDCEAAMRVMAEVLELQRTQEPYAIVERVNGQMVLRFTNGQVLQQVAEGTKLYRLQTLPSNDEQKTLYDWSKAPEWANWCAQDECGLIFWYKDKPKRGSNCWYPTTPSEEIHRIKHAFKGLPNKRWQDSREKRPQRRNYAPTSEVKHAATTVRINSEPVIIGEGQFWLKEAIPCRQNAGQFCTSDCQCGKMTVGFSYKEQPNTIKDYAIWQAITDLESRCRHRASGLQIEVEDKEHSPVVQYALEILEECGVEIIRDARYPNIKINYDYSNNKFFGKQSKITESSRKYKIINNNGEVLMFLIAKSEERAREIASQRIIGEFSIIAV